MNARNPIPDLARGLMKGVALGLAAVTLATPAQAAFHLWSIREVYSDASGAFQFIELFTPFSGQQFVGGQTITVTPTGGGASHSFTIPANLPGDTTGHALLIGTGGILAVGGPVPNFFIPENFLFAAGGTISFFGANGGIYTALPIDGVLSRTWGNGNATNTPLNFAGQAGQVTLVAPAITAQPQNQTTAIGSNATFSVTATGTGPLNYQWFFNQPNALGSSTFAPLILSNVRFANAGGYSVVITNSVGSVTSAVATLTVDALDPVFNPDANSSVFGTILQLDGKILIGGAFDAIGGTTRNRAARLNNDGTLDPSFNPNVSGVAVYSMTVQLDGKIVIGGAFTTVGGTLRNNLARLDPTGVLDA